MLLRREVLQLGLYSLRYLDVDQVVVFMPPRRGGHASQALFFRRPRCSTSSQKPLETTLVDRAPTVARMTKSPDALLVQRLTLPALFRFNVPRITRATVRCSCSIRSTSARRSRRRAASPRRATRTARR